MKPMRVVRAKRSQSSILALPSTKLIKPTTSRRSFFSMLGLGLASIIAAPSLLSKPSKDFSKLVWHGELKPSSVSWTDNDVELFNRLPYYLARMQVERDKEWINSIKLFDKTNKWKPDMGSVMRAVKD